MAVRLTVKQVENFQPSFERIEIPDAAAPGLHLIVQPTGVKSWGFRYRRKSDSAPKKYTIGRFPDYTLAEAREEALELARVVRKGGDPCGEKKSARAKAKDQGNTVSAQLDVFMSEYVRATGKANTIDGYEQVIEAEIRPAWGDRKIDSITKRVISWMV